MSATTTGTLLVVAVALTALAVLHRGARRADAEQRARLFDAVVPLVEDARLTGDAAHGYPVLSGRVGGRPVTLRAVVDTLALRKLPVLWVEIVQERPLEIEGTLNVLLRPQGCEFFSPDAGFGHEIAPPPEVPRPVRISCAAADRAPSTDVLVPAAGLLREPTTKELSVGRRGLRAVLLVAEGDQASYRTTRRAVFDRPRVDPGAVTAAVAVLGEIGDRAGDRVGAGS